MKPTTTDKLMQDLHVAVGDAEELLKETADQPGERVQVLRARTANWLCCARDQLERAVQDLNRTAREGARQLNWDGDHR